MRSPSASIATLIALLAGSAISYLLLALANNERAKKIEALGIAAQIIDNPAIQIKKDTVSGRFKNFGVRFQIGFDATRPKGTQFFTKIDVLITNPSITFEIRPETERERKYVKQGLAIDARLFDPGFDEAFIVEIAPRSSAPHLFTADIRKRMKSLHPMIARSSDKGIHIELDRWLSERAQIRDALETAVSLASRLEKAISAARETFIAEARASSPAKHSIPQGYRSAPETSAPARPNHLESAADQRIQNEIQKLNEFRMRRRVHERRLNIIGLGFFIAAVLCLLLFTWLAQ